MNQLTNVADPPSYGGNHEPRTMNNVPRYMRYAIRDTQYAIRAPALYICREPSTNQLLFMQNKPNLQKAKMNVNLTLTKDYRKKDDFIVRINKPNSNPILSAVGGFSKAKMNLKSLSEKSGHIHIFRLLLRGQIHLTKPGFKVKLGDVGCRYKLGIV